MTPPSLDTDINLVLLSPDKKIREASDVLSRMYRLILRDCVVSWQKWSTLLTLHLDRTYKGRLVSMDKITNDRNNLRKGLGAPWMSFETFVKGIDVLNPETAELNIWLEMGDGKAIGHVCDLKTITPENSNRELAKVFHGLCEALGKDPTNLSEDIDRYVNDPKRRAVFSGRQKGNDKGNLKRELSRDSMTFEVFKKGLRILNPVVTHFEITLKWTEDRVTRHHLKINSPK